MSRPSRRNTEYAATGEVPCRSLEPPSEPSAVAIRSAGHHPFVYRKMVAGPVGGPRPADGDLVRIVDREGLPIGFGLWNGRSQIALRILDTGMEPPGADFWQRRLTQAIALRTEFMKLDDRTNAYR